MCDVCFVCGVRVSAVCCVYLGVACTARVEHVFSAVVRVGALCIVREMCISSCGGCVVTYVCVVVRGQGFPSVPCLVCCVLCVVHVVCVVWCVLCVCALCVLCLCVLCACLLGCCV